MVSVAEKKIPNYNFSLPKPIAEEFRRLGDQRGERNKLRWAVASAAVLKLLEMPEAEMDELIKKVIGLRTYEKDLQALVDEAKAKGGREVVAPPAEDESVRGGKGKDLQPIRGYRKTGGITRRVQ